MDKIKVYDINVAAALITYGIRFIGVEQEWDVEKKKNFFCYIFDESTDTQNIITLYDKQRDFLAIERDKFVDLIKNKIRAHEEKTGGARQAFRESTRKIKGASKKVNGVWKG